MVFYVSFLAIKPSFVILTYMSIHEQAKSVHQSYIRAGGKAFVMAFYERLMAASEEIRGRFEHIDMEAQADILAHAIVMSFLFVDTDHQSAKKCLDGVRESHSRDRLNIAPELYDTWLECLLETVAACDPQTDEELLSHWHKVMSVAINHIREGY